MELTMSERKAVTKVLATEYRRASKARKGEILDQISAVKGVAPQSCPQGVESGSDDQTRGQFRSRPCQRVRLGEGGPPTARVRAAPDTLRSEPPHGPAETGNVVEPDLTASMAHRNDTAARATGKIITGLDVQNQALRGCRNGTDVEPCHTEQRIGACTTGHGNKT
jgi:hypothetical protein